MIDVSITKDILIELNKMGFSDYEKLSIDKMRSKNGIHLFRIGYKNSSFVLKYFSNFDDTREILNYDILTRLRIPTIKVVAKTDASLLLEDIIYSETYRLGKSDDLSDTDVAGLIAQWYKSFHAEGEKYLKTSESKLYRETDVISKENIAMVRDKSGTYDNPVWTVILDNLHAILDAIEGLNETLTYNDFYWTNLIVRKDKTAAFMFDYNLLGRGYRYSDVRNVCSSLSDKCKIAFIEEYGDCDDTEKLVDTSISVLTGLISAYQRPSFPSWADNFLKRLKNGYLLNSIRKII